ncbi:MAG: hypothetical protein ACRDVG_10940, partial [Jatrophihabitantaceae bacterium]
AHLAQFREPSGMSRFPLAYLIVTARLLADHRSRALLPTPSDFCVVTIATTAVSESCARTSLPTGELRVTPQDRLALRVRLNQAA